MKKNIQDNNILLCITGGSPQVVTETLYCLITQNKPYIPTEIHIVSTSTGIQKAQSMLETKQNIMQEFCEVMQDKLNGIKYASSFGEEPGNIIYHPIKGKDNLPISDIYTLEDSEATADEIVALIQGLCSIKNEDNANIKQSLHVSIAGGRKTMGFYAGYALSIFGRSNDKLSHVLIESEDGTKPSIFENNPTFYFPKQKSKVEIRDFKTKEVIEEVSAKEAKLALTEIPIVKLSSHLPHDFSINYDKNKTVQSYSEIVNRAQRAMNKDDYNISFDIVGSALICNGFKIKIEPKLLAFYLAVIKYFYEIKKGEPFACDGPFIKIFLSIWNFMDETRGCIDPNKTIDYDDQEFWKNLKKCIELYLNDEYKNSFKTDCSKLELFVLKSLDVSDSMKEPVSKDKFNSCVFEYHNSTSGIKAIYCKIEKKKNKTSDDLMPDSRTRLNNDTFYEKLFIDEADYLRISTEKGNGVHPTLYYLSIDPKHIDSKSTMGVLNPKFY